MNKIKFIAVFLLILAAISCSQIKDKLNEAADSGRKKSKIPVTNFPRNIKNAVSDPHFGEEKAIVVSVSENGEYHVGSEPFIVELIDGEIERLLATDPSEQQLIYLNADKNTEFGKIAKALESLRRAKIENVGIRVAPNDTDKQFYILKVKIPAKPNIDKYAVKPNPYTLVLTITTDYKLTLNKEELFQSDKSAKLSEIFRQRENDGVFREGTNEIEKTVTIKASQAVNFANVVTLTDIAAGAGASPIYLQIDDLEM